MCDVKIYATSEKNMYRTSLGSSIHIYRENGSQRLRITNNDTDVSYKEIKQARYNLLNSFNKEYLFFIDDYGKDVVLYENNMQKDFSPFGKDKYVKLEEKYITAQSKRYFMLITKDSTGDSDEIIHMSVSDPEDVNHICLSDLKKLRLEYLPKDSKFAMLFPPQENFINMKKTCYHIFEHNY